MIQAFYTNSNVFIEQVNGSADPILYIWDADTDQLQSFNFTTGKGQDGLDDSVAEAQQQLSVDIKGF